MHEIKIRGRSIDQCAVDGRLTAESQRLMSRSAASLLASDAQHHSSSLEHAEQPLDTRKARERPVAGNLSQADPQPLFRRGLRPSQQLARAPATITPWLKRLLLGQNQARRGRRQRLHSVGHWRYKLPDVTRRDKRATLGCASGRGRNAR